MSEPGKIRIPWQQRWRRIRYGVLPSFSFALAVACVVYLWRGQYGSVTATGEVMGRRMDLASSIAGQLVDLPRTLELFEPVTAGDIVARLDDKDLLAQLEVLKQELAHLKLVPDSEAEKIRQDDSDRHLRQIAETRQLAEHIERLKVAILKLRAQRSTDLVLKEELREIYETAKRFREGNLNLLPDLLQAESNFKVAEERIKSTEGQMRDIAKLLAEAQQRMNSQPRAAVSEVAKLLEPARLEIQVQEERIHELDVRREALEIRSPINGIIAAILKRPGQTVAPNEPILTIAAVEGQYVLSYFRQGKGPAPHADMAVDLRTRSLPREVFHTRVEKIGPQVEAVPQHQWRDPRISEWGLPVRITLPPTAIGRVRPGELLDVRLLPQVGAAAAEGGARRPAANEAKLHKSAGL